MQNLLYAGLIIWVVRALLLAISYKVYTEMVVQSRLQAEKVPITVRNFYMPWSMFWREVMLALFMPLRRSRLFDDGQCVLQSRIFFYGARPATNEEIRDLPYQQFVVRLKKDSPARPGYYIRVTPTEFTVLESIK